jgi:phosphoribosylglycinamide formyltransferase-1
MPSKKRVAVLISGSGSNLQALVDAAKYDDFPASIELVISNKADAYGLTRAQNAKITTRVLSHSDYATREEYDTQIDLLLNEFSIEFVCLAGFMRLLSAGFTEKWQGRMLNIHPSLLPQFKGAHAIADALNAGAKTTGCTVHLVTPEMDAGPILMQAEVEILSGDTLESLAERIHKQEHRIYPAALKALIEETHFNA